MSGSGELGALPPELAGPVAQFNTALDAAEAALQPFCAAKMNVVAKKLGPLDKARLNTALAFATTSLVFAHLRAGGLELRDHPVREEIKAVQTLSQRIAELDKFKDSAAPKIDTAAAGRLVRAAVSTANFTSHASEAPSAIGNKRREADAAAAGSGEGAGTAAKRPRPADDAVGAIAKPADSDSDSDSDSESSAGKRSGSVAGGGAGAGAGGHGRQREGDDRGRSGSAGRGGGRGGRGGRGGGGAGAGGGSGRGGKGKDDSKRSTPAPKLSHLNWREEMDKKFGK